MSPSQYRHRPLPLLLLSVVAGIAAGGPAWAQSANPPRAQAPRGAAQHDPGQRRLSDAVRRAERAGQVLSAEQVQYDGRDVNRVKIVDDRGRVRVYWDDPASRGDRKTEDSRPSKTEDSRPSRQSQPARDRTRHDDDDDPTL